MRKLLLGFAMMGGLALTAYLTARTGFAEVGAVVGSAGSALGLVVLAHLGQVGCSAVAWSLVIREQRPSLGVVARLRWIRESISNLLPMTQIGGEVVAMRLLAMRGIDTGRGTASILIDVTLEFVMQVPFTLCGLLLFLARESDTPAAGALIGATVVLSTIALAFVLAQRGGLWLRVETVLERIAERLSVMQTVRAPGLHAAITATYADRRTVLRSCCWHLASWFAGAGEIWLAMYAIGIPADFTEALILESLGQATRSAAFMIPGGLGVQEGSYLLLGGLLGIAPDAALGLSFIKRVRELVLGVPGLATWYAIEGRHAWRRRQAAG